MGTRSIIAIKTKEGTFKSVYCHWDGYLTHNGALLVDHYNSEDRVNVLIGLGDISSLRSEINPKPNEEHSFDKPAKDVTVFYGRDRGETNVGYKTHNTLQELFNTYNNSWGEYLYVFDNGKWYYLEDTKDNFEEVEEGLKKWYGKYQIERPKDFYGYLTDDNIKNLQNGLTIQEIFG